MVDYSIEQGGLLFHWYDLQEDLCQFLKLTYFDDTSLTQNRKPTPAFRPNIDTPVLASASADKKTDSLHSY